MSLLDATRLGHAENLRALLRALRSVRILAANESEMQAAIAATLGKAALDFEREVSLAPGDRIDFLIGNLGVEVKVAGSLSEVTRQMHRYAQSPRLSALCLLTTRSSHLRVPRELNNKPVHVEHLIGGMF